MPKYLGLSKKDFSEKIKSAYELLEKCTICPHSCGVNRRKGEKGVCNSTEDLLVSSVCVHLGEEPPISGINGSGTIFFSNCSLKCKFCQNYEISHSGAGKKMSIDHLADEMINLQSKGCHNINLVTPTHFIPQILKTLETAREKGLNIPIVYNTGGYDSVEALKLLDGIIDIYMPDMKYSRSETAFKLSGIKKYTENNRKAVLEMARQAGSSLVTDNNGVAVQGLLIRLLVLPNNLAGIYESLKFIKNNISCEVAVSLMSQYHPVNKGLNDSSVNRRILISEYKQALTWLKEFNFTDCYIQQLESSDVGLPDFNKEQPFDFTSVKI